MKKVYIALFLIFLLGMLVAGCQPKTIESSTYTNMEYGFSVNYPKDWKISEFDEKGIHTVSFEKKPKVAVQVWAFYAPVYYSKFPSLDIFYENALYIHGEYEDFRILEEYDTIVSGLPAKGITVTFVAKDFSWEQTMILFLEKIPYQIIYTPMGPYSDYYDHFNLIVNSFRFTK